MAICVSFSILLVCQLVKQIIGQSSVSQDNLVYQLSWRCKLAIVKNFKADVSSIRFAQLINQLAN